MYSNAAVLLLVVALGALFAPSVVTAGSINYGDYVTETMMEVQSEQQSLLQAAAPWALNDAVHYQYSYDRSTGAFGFSTDVGQSIAGSAFSFSTVAVLDSATGTWSWTGAGLEGGTSIDMTGLAVLTGDPQENITGQYHDGKGNVFDATATVTIEEDTTGLKKSFGQGSATDPTGKLVFAGKVTDFVRPSGTWEIVFEGDTNETPGIKSQLDFGLESQIDPTTFQGDFTQTVLPEPATWVMMLMGVGGLGAATRRSRPRRTVSSAPPSAAGVSRRASEDRG
jgi:hypothetical protein